MRARPGEPAAVRAPGAGRGLPSAGQVEAGAVVARLPAEAMLVEHLRIIDLVDWLGTTSEPVAAAALARALRELFESHLAEENDQILPLLVASSDVSVAGLLGGMHELPGGEDGAADVPGSPGKGGRSDRTGYLRHPAGPKVPDLAEAGECQGWISAAGMAKVKARGLRWLEQQ